MCSSDLHQRVLSIILFLCFVLLAGMVSWTVISTEKVARQVSATGRALMQSQRLAKSVSQASVGNVSAFPEVKDSAAELRAAVDGLQRGNEQVSPLRAAYLLVPHCDLELARPLLRRLLSALPQRVSAVPGRHHDRGQIGRAHV